MNYPHHIARNLAGKHKKGVTGPVIRVSVFSIALSIVVMLLAFAIVRGFQKEIKEKIIGFGSHIQIRPFDTNESLEQTPVAVDRPDIDALQSVKGIKSIFPFVEKGGLVKTDSNLHGVVMKGVNNEFDWSFLEKNLVKGSLPSYMDSVSDEVMISSRIATLLNLDLDSALRVYFIIPGEVQPRGRKFVISGIYSTGMSEFDQVYAICDMRHLQKLNSWGDSLVSGYELLLNDFEYLNPALDEVNQTIYYDLYAEDIVSRQAQFFDWLNLLDSNVLIILLLMTLVAIINIISIILILILERIPLIGLLKALGSGNGFIRKVFLYMSARLLLMGVFWGNVVGLGLLFLQNYLKIFPLNEDMYYISYVPVLIKADYILFVNIGVLTVSAIAVLMPSFIIRRIHPSAALQYK